MIISEGSSRGGFTSKLPSVVVAGFGLSSYWTAGLSSWWLLDGGHPWPLATQTSSINSLLPQSRQERESATEMKITFFCDLIIPSMLPDFIGWSRLLKRRKIPEDGLETTFHTRPVEGSPRLFPVSLGHCYHWMSGVLKTIVSCILSAVKIHIVTPDFVIVPVFFGCSGREDTPGSHYFTVAERASPSSDTDSYLFKFTENCFGLTSGLSWGLCHVDVENCESSSWMSYTKYQTGQGVRECNLDLLFLLFCFVFLTALGQLLRDGC